MKRKLLCGMLLASAVLTGCTACASFPPGDDGGTDGGGQGPSGLSNYFLPNKPQGSLVSNRLPQVAVDSKGGIHAVYAANAVDGTGRRPAYYAFCAGNCSGPNAFTIVPISDGLGFGQLALDSAGRPRLLLAVGPDGNNTLQYQYWACDANCTQSGQWHGVVVTTAQASFFPSYTERRQSFALDPQGRPRFVYFSNPFGATGLTGNIYASCDTGCTTAGSWKLTRLSDVEWRDTALAFSPNGLPRIAFTAKNPNPDYEPLFNYLECDQSNCAGANQGQTLLRTTLSGPKSDPVFALRTDSSGNPRILLYPGTGSGGDLPPNHLVYLSCNSNCASKLESWQVLSLGLPQGHGQEGVDFVLDAQNRPSVAYRIPAPTNELAYLVCSSNCETSPSDWKGGYIPSTAAAEQELGLPPRMGCPDCIPPIPPCPNAFYDAGYWPSISLDGAGNPRIAFEVQLQHGGGQCTAGVLARLSRLAVFPRP